MGIIFTIKRRQYLTFKTFLKTPTVQALSLLHELRICLIVS